MIAHMKKAIFTIIAKNYLSYARVLMASVRRWSPDSRRIVILADEPEGYFEPPQEDFEIIYSRDLPIPNSAWFHFKYTVLELSTAVKPYVFDLLFDRGFDKVIYFDPDINIYGSVNPIFELLESSSIVLTPHLTAPLHDNLRPTDLDILRSGTFNLGFIALRGSVDGREFIAWWEAKLFDQCVVDLAKGLFVDQKWIDLVPGLFGGVTIVRDPGYNVAYWNIAQRTVTRVDDGYLANGRPLIFFHFSGFDPQNPAMFSRHQNRFRLNDLGDARGLILAYRELLLAAGHKDSKTWPYKFAKFSNGFLIPDMGRPAHHESPELAVKISDPFSDAGFQAFVRIWNEPLAGPDGKPTGITRLAHRVYKSRFDVQTVMPDIFGGDLVRFLDWMLSSGRKEHGIDAMFLDPISRALASSARPNGQPPAPPANDVGEKRLVNERVIQACSRAGIWVDDGRKPLGIDNLNELIENGSAKLHLSRLAKAIYVARPDVQAAFPDPSGRDGVRFLLWFLTYGRAEYRLEQELLGPLRQQWDVIVHSHGWLTRWWFRARLWAMDASVSSRQNLPRATKAPRSSAEVPLPPEPEPLPRAASPRASSAAPPVGPDGLNLIGYFKSEMGVGESVRCALRSIRAAGILTSLRSVDDRGPYRLGDHSAGHIDDKLRYGVNLFHVNADQSRQIVQRLGDDCLTGRVNIGYWAWELEEFPDRWRDAFDLFDEIWTPSRFCQEAIARKSPVPVVRIPHSIDLETQDQSGVPSFSLPSNAFTFLAVFDLLSVLERKNPLAVIEAFARAFESNPAYHLVLKINHASERPAEARRVAEAAAGLPVTIIDATIDRPDVIRLIASCDCLVSLHRSEGFGLALAEAMYLRKPVIATGYSGNLDFMTPHNSFLVEHRLIPVPHGCDPYDPGALWAEPLLEDAVDKMLLVAKCAELRQERAAKAEESIKRDFCPAAVGKMMADRIARISARPLRSAMVANA